MLQPEDCCATVLHRPPTARGPGPEADPDYNPNRRPWGGISAGRGEVEKKPHSEGCELWGGSSAHVRCRVGHGIFRQYAPPPPPLAARVLEFYTAGLSMDVSGRAAGS